jgi:hypothetical protein
MGYVIGVITAFLRAQAPRVLPQIASKLSALIGKSVPATVPGMINIIKAFVGNNMGKLTFIITTLASYGFNFDYDEMAEKAPALIPYKDSFDAVMTAAVAKLREDNLTSRHEHTGDGVKNAPIEDDGELAQAIAARAVILRASIAVGGVPALNNIREAIFMDESTYQKGLALQQSSNYHLVR